MYKSVVAVCDGEKVLGDVEVYFNPHLMNLNMREKLKDKIRISYYSTPSERCSPLAVLHTITSPTTGVCLKLECSNTINSNSQLHLLHSSCLRENKTAVVSLGGEELHLVAMRSRRNDLFPCFWGFNVAPGLYESCLVMLNLRCLGIVFDLDETLIVANTLRSFEDRIEALQRKVSCEVDPQRVAGMLAEIKRYQDDRNILKQYAESDQVVDNGKVIKSQSEAVPALSDNHQPLVRPLIRLQEKNVILTRINPLIRDTSVLVRLRPAWEDLRSYLIARGRKRFEVYVCTMAERDYALEMWRLLDPDSNLISTKELLNRIVCVKSGKLYGNYSNRTCCVADTCPYEWKADYLACVSSITSRSCYSSFVFHKCYMSNLIVILISILSGLKKSLFNVFQDGNCHPKMALVIDDRLKVWDEKDQPRVHVVPAFAPYYAPQAEANSAVPILCVARNVACNVRGGFFKDFDDGLLQQITEVAHEDEIKDIPLPPDVSNYLISEDDASALNGNKEPLGFDGMADVEVERRLKDAIAASTISPVIPTLDPVLKTTFQYNTAPAAMPQPTIVPPTIPGPIVQYPNKQLPQATPVLEPFTKVNLPETSLHSSPAREEGEVPESELDPDTRRRLLILQHGMDMRDQISSEPQFPVRPPPMQVSAPRVDSRGGWFPMGEEIGPRQLNRIAPPKEFPLHPEPMHIEKKHPLRAPLFVQKVETSLLPDRVLENQRLPKEALQRDDRLRLSHSPPVYPSFPGEESSLGQSSSSNRDMDIEAGNSDSYAESPAEYLHYIAYKCGTKAEFKQALVPSIELQFSFEVWFAGERIGEGSGRTRREAQHQAAEASLMNLADKYLSRLKSGTSSVHGDDGRFVNDGSSFGHQSLLREESMTFSTASGPMRALDTKLDGSKKGSIAALNELCMMEGLGMTFQPQPQASTNMGQNNELYAQVEIDGEVWGKGVGLTWDEAKMQAAETAFQNLKSRIGQYPQKRQPSPRSFQGMSTKRFRPEYPRVLQRMPSSARYPKNASPVP
ncbi:RNA polymerase II C-terminal domain phosphatase-like 1 isoform X2 [Cynara cardunculus var. scolymus]|uniref:RNA polymerase II C-terminal domain phosphatase-like 1 isoform X2 n=1 Tax=Cynara cardunculus var. scolymus TaxID=59895 RepID=UPI000D6309EE|nr:RNA polymerase II C-terminal domain phosphatase-like 1 isoform X2 [Cynara cardunculus var. scolymus]